MEVSAIIAAVAAARVAAEMEARASLQDWQPDHKVWQAGGKAASAAFTAVVWASMGSRPVEWCACRSGCQCAPEDREARKEFWRRRQELLREIFISEESTTKVGYLGNHISDSGVHFDSAVLAGFKLKDFQKYLEDNREDAMAARRLYRLQGSWHEPRDNRASLTARFYDVVESFVKRFA